MSEALVLQMEDSMAVSPEAKCWLEGIKAYEEGKSKEDCPYPASSTSYYEWVEGWMLGEVMVG